MFGNILCGFFGHHISYNTLFLLHLENMKIYYKDMLHFYQKDEVCIFRYVKVIIKYDEFRNHWKYNIMIDDIHCVVRIIDETKPSENLWWKFFCASLLGAPTKFIITPICLNTHHTVWKWSYCHLWRSNCHKMNR